MMSVEENKEMVRRYFDERWNKHNLDVIDEMLASSQEAEEEKERVRSQLTMISDLKLTILDLIGEGDQVAIHIRVDGVHQGGLLGVATTGQTISNQGVAWLRITDGKIVSYTAYYDVLTMLEQLGAAPQTE